MQIKKGKGFVEVSGKKEMVEIFINNNNLEFFVVDEKEHEKKGVVSLIFKKETQELIENTFVLSYIESLLFNVLTNMNVIYDIGVNFDGIEHSEILIETRYQIIELLKERV